METNTGNITYKQVISMNFDIEETEDLYINLGKILALQHDG